MKYSKKWVLFFLILSSSSFGQISFLKEINTIEDGSNPESFVEVNGVTYFTVKKLDGYQLWKTDGTEAGTVAITDSTKSIIVQPQQNSIPTFYNFNNEIYYLTRSPSGLQQLWKYDGLNESLVLDNFAAWYLYFLNNQIFYFNYNGLFKIEAGQSVLVKDLGSNSFFTQPPPAYLGNELIFFTQNSGNSSRLKIWKTDGTEPGTVAIKDIDSLFYLNSANYSYLNASISIDGNVYFVLKRLLDISTYYKVVTELWKTNGVNTVLVKIIDSDNNMASAGYKDITNLAKFNGKLIFIYDNSQLWISDGTNTGTNLLKTSDFYRDFYNRKWGFLGTKFYFNDRTDNDYELWESDGTVAGTKLFKNLNPTESSNPNYFATINNKLFFKANNDELWQSDGTETGTNFILNIPKPTNWSSNERVVPEFIFTSNNQLIFKNYDSTHDFELWKSDGTIQNTQLLKNIVTLSKNGVYSKKVKLGNIWYFLGTDHRGTELWKTDGTSEGTTIVKDITAGEFSTYVRETVATSTKVYFTVNSTNENRIRLYQTDGTEIGTSEIVLNSATQYPVSPKSLTVTGEKLFFTNSNDGRGLWVSDGTSLGTFLISNPNFNWGAPANLTRLNNGKILFTSDGLWMSDGTVSGTIKVFGDAIYNVPRNPICLVEFKGKVYFFSFYISLPNYIHKFALFVSDGTPEGTSIVREFDSSDNLISSSQLFLEKSSDRLYFRTFNLNMLVRDFHLWMSDGTTEGTQKLVTMPYLPNPYFKFTSIQNQFYFFINTASELVLWTTNGTVNGTHKLLTTQKSNIGESFGNIGANLYFSIHKPDTGYELWTSNGTISGTYLVDEIREGIPTSGVNSIMEFENKLIFGAYDNNRGNELWQYFPQNCEEGFNYAVQSGSWDNPNTWSCGHIPTQDEIIIIKKPHSVFIPNNYQTQIKRFSTEKGSVLSIPTSSTILINAN